VASDIVMPRLSDSMEEGTILRWIKSEGEEVEVGEELVEIETDKANMVYESDTAGTLIEIVANEDDTLPVGAVIARVGEPGEAPAEGDGAGKRAESEDAAREEEDTEEAEATAEAPKEPQAPVATEAAGETEAVAEAARGDGRIKASPIARRIARERGLDLAGIEGSGPGGRIVKADVERAAEAPAKAPAETRPAEEPAAAPTPAAVKAAPTPGVRERPETAKGETEVRELNRVQQTIARRMAESKATAPHFYLNAEIDMTNAVAARARLKEMAADGEPVPTFNDMIVKACALALREHPLANGAYRDGKVELHSRVNVGIAVAAGIGDPASHALVVPTVFDADRKGLRQIAIETRALAQRVREGTITPPELSGGTFTVSNLGMLGISHFSAVINPPQAGILSVGELNSRPAFDGSGELAQRQIMVVNLACDHRILYGADGAAFLGRVRELLEEPVALAL
jgi:pyruvate dehydrogenase E2 component (dihydrolipoamide acetyltransferase)